MIFWIILPVTDFLFVLMNGFKIEKEKKLFVIRVPAKTFLLKILLGINH